MNLSIKDLFFFDEMLTPKIITLIYWLLLLLVVISGLGIFISDLSLVSFIGGLFTIILGAAFARIWCEILIVIFKIHENLRKVAEK